MEASAATTSTADVPVVVVPRPADPVPPASELRTGTAHVDPSPTLANPPPPQSSAIHTDVGALEDANERHPTQAMHGLLFFGLDLSGPVLGMAAASLGLAIVFPVLWSGTRVQDGLALLCLIPSIIAASWAYYRRGHVIQFRQLFARYCLGWLALLPASWFFGFLICIVWLILCGILSLKLPALLVLIILLLGVFTSIAGTEEAMKYMVLCKFDNFDALPNPELYPLFSSATALGLGTGASYYLVIFIRVIVDSALTYSGCHSHSTMSSDNYPASWSGSASSSSSGLQGVATANGPVTDGSASGARFATPAPSTCGVHMTLGQIIGLIVICVFIAQPVQLLASYHVGLVVARVQVLRQQINATVPIAITIVFRGFFMALFLILLVAMGPLALLPAIIIAGCYVVYVKSYERNMPRDYLERAGYINFFGYGLVSQDDDGENHPAPAASAVQDHEV